MILYISDNEDAGACAMSHTTPAHSTPHRGSNRGAHQRSVSYDSHYYSHPQLEVSAHDDEEGMWNMLSMTLIFIFLFYDFFINFYLLLYFFAMNFNFLSSYFRSVFI